MRKFFIITLLALVAAIALQSQARDKDADLLKVFAERTVKVDKHKLKYREVLVARHTRSNRPS